MVTHGLRLLLGMFVACGVARASILTMSLNVRENFAPSRKAILTFSDGSNSLRVDLYHSMLYGEVPGLGYCQPSASPGCTFTPGGSLTGNPLILSCSENIPPSPVVVLFEPTMETA